VVSRLALAAAGGWLICGHALAQDAASVIADAQAALGDVTSITYSGSARDVAFQQCGANATHMLCYGTHDPMRPIMSYERVIDLSAPMSRHRGERIPSKDDIDPVDLAKLNMIGTVHILDVSPDNPAHFFFRLYGSKMTLDNGKNYTGLRIGDYPVEIWSTALQEDYLSVKYTGLPRYQHVGAFMNNSTRGYTRLTLPLASNGYHIDKLLIGVKFQKIEIPPRLL